MLNQIFFLWLFFFLFYSKITYFLAHSDGIKVSDLPLVKYQIRPFVSKCFVTFFLFEPKGSMVSAYFTSVQLLPFDFTKFTMSLESSHSYDKLIYIFVGTTISLSFCYIFEIYLYKSIYIYACLYISII